MADFDCRHLYGARSKWLTPIVFEFTSPFTLVYDMHHPAINPPVDLAKLDFQTRVISTESFTSINIPGVFRGLAQGVKDTFQHVHEFMHVDDLPKLPSDQRKFLNTIHAMGYASVMDTKAQRPEGLKVHYLEYTAVLKRAAVHVSSIQGDVVAPYMDFLTRFSASNQFSTSASSETAEFRKKAQIRDRIIADMGKCFGKESYATDCLIKDVVQRNGDWDHVLQEVKQLHDGVSAINRQEIINTVNGCTDVIEVIIKQFASMGDRKVSKEAAERLYNHAYHVGRELELYATVHYRVLALQASVLATMDALMENYA